MDTERSYVIFQNQAVGQWHGHVENVTFRGKGIRALRLPRRPQFILDTSQLFDLHLYINVTAPSRAPSLLRLAPFSVASSSLPITELHEELRKASLGRNQRPLQPKLSKGNLKQTLSPSGDADTLISLSHLTEGASLAPRWRGALIRYQAHAASEMMSDERRSWATASFGANTEILVFEAALWLAWKMTSFTTEGH